MIDPEFTVDGGRDGVRGRELAVLPDDVALGALDQREHEQRERDDGQHGQFAPVNALSIASARRAPVGAPTSGVTR